MPEEPTLDDRTQTIDLCQKNKGVLYSRDDDRSGRKYCVLSKLTNQDFCRYLTKDKIKVMEGGINLRWVEYRGCGYRR